MLVLVKLIRIVQLGWLLNKLNLTNKFTADLNLEWI